MKHSALVYPESCKSFEMKLETVLVARHGTIEDHVAQPEFNISSWQK